MEGYSAVFQEDYDINIFGEIESYTSINLKILPLHIGVMRFSSFTTEEYVTFLYHHVKRVDIRIRIRKAFIGVKKKYQMLLEEWMSGKRLDYEMFEPTQDKLEEERLIAAADELEEERLQKRQK